MANESWEKRKKEKKEIKDLLKSETNKKWYHKQWWDKAWGLIGGLFVVWQIPGFFGIPWPPQLMIVLALIIIVILIVTRKKSRTAIKEYLHKKVETERPGCTVEIRVADSYLTNAFEYYPKAAMMIGINKAFWFQEAEPNSLVADMWGTLKSLGIPKEEVQKEIDAALDRLVAKEEKEMLEGAREEGEGSIDYTRPKVYVRKTVPDEYCEKDENGNPKKDEKGNLIYRKDENGEPYKDFVERRNFKIGTIVGVDLRWTTKDKDEQVFFWSLVPGAFASNWERIKYNNSHLLNCCIFGRKAAPVQGEKPKGFFEYIKSHRIKHIKGKENLKKLYFIANAEVVQGKDTKEPMKVTSDKNAPVTESFENIWEYFEHDEEMTEYPPESTMYTPLLIPLIGAGVANEGYTDLEIFSQLVDLYFKYLRKSIRAGMPPAIAQLIINIRNNTAIDLEKTNRVEGRKIDIETAFWYLDYKNQVNPPIRQKEEEIPITATKDDTKNGEEKRK